jgi:hypothetical protein
LAALLFRPVHSLYLDSHLVEGSIRGGAALLSESGLLYIVSKLATLGIITIPPSRFHCFTGYKDLRRGRPLDTVG